MARAAKAKFYLASSSPDYSRRFVARNAVVDPDSDFVRISRIERVVVDCPRDDAASAGPCLVCSPAAAVLGGRCGGCFRCVMCMRKKKRNLQASVLVAVLAIGSPLLPASALACVEEA